MELYILIFSGMSWHLLDLRWFWRIGRVFGETLSNTFLKKQA